MIYSILFLILSNAINLRIDKSILYNRNLIYILIITLIIGLFSLIFKNINIGLFSGLFHTTTITTSFHIFIFFITIIILQLTAFYSRKLWIKEYKINNFYNIYYNTKILNKLGEQLKIIEYPLILLFIITGSTFLISSSDIVSIFISIELQSYGLYLLCTLYRNSELSTSAGLTYFLLGGLSSCFILLGLSLLYVNSGTTNLDGYYIITNLSQYKNNINNIVSIYNIDYINLSLLIMSIGFLFKVSAAPFHFWSPDVYDAIPTIVTTFVAIVAKISIFIFLLELVHFTNNFYFSFNWTKTLLFSSLLSLIIGTVLGLNQSRIKRLFAYSTITHLGLILLALNINTIESIQGFTFYIMQYSITNLNSFIILISIGYTLYIYTNSDNQYKELKDKNNSPIQLISQLKGYFYINPVLSISFIITLYSLVGIPPLVGFFGKQMILSSALDKGYIFMALIAILTSVISAVYYLNIVKQIFFDKSNYKLDSENKNIKLFVNIDTNSQNINNNYNINNIVLSNSLSITISYLTLIILLFIFKSEEWLTLCNILALITFN